MKHFHKLKTIIDNSDTITLRGYYQKLRDSHNDFVKIIAEKTGRTERAVRMWISGDVLPPAAARNIIAEYTGIPVEQLFPVQND